VRVAHTKVEAEPAQDKAQDLLADLAGQGQQRRRGFGGVLLGRLLGGRCCNGSSRGDGRR
jgi:hypothetical protein